MSIQSKRSIILFVAVCLIYVLLSEELKIGIALSVLFVSVLVILAGYYSIYVKFNYRSYVFLDEIYTSLRIDFFRDDTTKMVLYSLLNQDAQRILSFPGQSFLYQIGSMFPLSFLGVPYIGYNTFVTTYMLGVSVSAGYNWMTTSIFDEMIANFGLLGFWIAPALFGILGKIADKQTIEYRKYTVATATLLLMYSLNYIMWFLQMWVLLVLTEKLIMRRRKRQVKVEVK